MLPEMMTISHRTGGLAIQTLRLGVPTCLVVANAPQRAVHCSFGAAVGTTCPGTGISPASHAVAQMQATQRVSLCDLGQDGSQQRY